MQQRCDGVCRTAVVADDHVEVFVEIELEKGVAHEVLDADAQNATGIGMQLKCDLRFIHERKRGEQTHFEIAFR